MNKTKKLIKKIDNEIENIEFSINLFDDYFEKNENNYSFVILTQFKIMTQRNVRILKLLKQLAEQQ